MARYQREVGGPLKGGNPGIRLLEPGGDAPPDAGAKAAPPPVAPATGETLVVPLYQIFGSEELSARSPAIRERGREAYLALHARDGGKLGLTGQGGRVRLHLDDRELTLSVLYDDTLPEGVAGLSVGGPGTTGIRFPFRAKITALEPGEEKADEGPEEAG
jgi:NADH-quinone oxidoreductase subunit G